MHPQLSHKREVCQEFIAALEACHASNWKRLTGGCNSEKDQLLTCLGKEARQRSSRNRAAAKERRQRAEQGWKELHEDD